ncbi:Short chain enoyl-CoA hydratase / 3-hydroxyacyl-CoA dehydrogenase [Thiocapsa sp. KS1]|nr:3-hydroxyacyl-CoA dehydrogenase NAD-binding domain-containing protein [Thiocapsa sp. KS1]CRI67555.1 Short chain enoyl-CoA hydratase / 3-hydroxyacyl-CoA dehydrogenase [Thiocapsa sp. KS1]
MNTLWTIEQDATDGICRLGIDDRSHSVNLLSVAALDELDACIARVENGLETGLATGIEAGPYPHPIKGLIIQSRKPKGFIAGADVGEFDRLADPSEAERHIRRVHALLARIEDLPIPTLALIHGVCLGGGLELALACRYRIASDDPATKLGFPEVRLGIFPGYGGTWRAIRTLGPVAAMQAMLTGQTYSARQAQRMGLVDRVLPQRQLEAGARDLLRAAPLPSRASFSQRLPNLPAVRGWVAHRMTRRTAAKVRQEHYPAPFALIEHWRANGANARGLLDGEARRVPELLLGETSTNLRRVFHLQERLKALSDVEVPRPQRVHVVGAGVMGGDIAAWCALNGLTVTLQDLSLDQIGRAMKRAHHLFEQRLRDPRLVRAAWDRLMPDPDGEGLHRTDLVIEAVAEQTELKQQLFAEMETLIPEHALLATNTSSIPIERIGEGLRDPGRLVGLHFFNPVARMQLVEVVQGTQTRPESMQRGLAAVRALDRLPLPVKSSPGFLVNRVLMPYLLEAVDLLDEGVSIAAIDKAAVDYGMPMGPLALADTVGLDICLAVSDTLGPALTAPEETPERLRRMVADGQLGKKSGRGFHRYRDGQAVPESISHGDRPPHDLTERLIFRLLNECVACLREGVVADPDLLDAGVVFGTGFAPHRGGPLHEIAQGGWERMRERLDTLQRDHGRHFRPDRGWQLTPAGLYRGGH